MITTAKRDSHDFPDLEHDPIDFRPRLDCLEFREQDTL